jgi:type II restriction/modification system DNA methylase subunit YeeA
MAKLHDALKAHGYDGHVLEVYLVRLLFCLFADSTDIFPNNSFRAYLDASKPDASDLSCRIERLFEILDRPDGVRKKRDLISDELNQFPYVNGSLFSETLPITDFDTSIRQILLECAKFNWSSISPAIFGAMFQGVMDKDKRREMGAHYTDEKNILKVINPLFLDDLWAEFERVKTDPKALGQFHEKIASLKFLDPACGCGNFLIVTYRELRILELEILKIKNSDNRLILDMLIKVKIGQFYGIELEEFPSQIAYVGMWLTDHQMNLKVSETFGASLCRLPLTDGSSIKVANALRVDWESVVAKSELAYILGNPPFAGGMMMTREQKGRWSIFLAT